MNWIDSMVDGVAAETLAVRRRRESRREEWQTQTQVVQLFARHLPAGAFATALENAPRTAVSGLLAKQRGTRPGLPDLLLIWGGEIVFVELKAAEAL